MPAILTRKVLDGLTCGAPDCDHTAHDELILHSRCHPDAPTWASYSAMTGVLTVRCSECEEPLARIAVSEGTA